MRIVLPVCFLVCAILLADNNSFAYPSIGDKVKWEGSINLLDGTVTPVQIVKEVLNYNSENKKWTVKYQATLGSETSTETTEVDSLYTPADFKTLLDQCTSKGGVLEKFTAPAGTYETCKMVSTNSDGVTVEKWWGNIPFGIVSKSTKDPRNNKTKKANLNSIIADL